MLSETVAATPWTGLPEGRETVFRLRPIFVSQLHEIRRFDIHTSALEALPSASELLAGGDLAT